jgi:hypothetical protein
MKLGDYYDDQSRLQHRPKKEVRRESPDTSSDSSTDDEQEGDGIFDNVFGKGGCQTVHRLSRSFTLFTDFSFLLSHAVSGGSSQQQGYQQQQQQESSGGIGGMISGLVSKVTGSSNQQQGGMSGPFDPQYAMSQRDQIYGGGMRSGVVRFSVA